MVDARRSWIFDGARASTIDKSPSARSARRIVDVEMKYHDKIDVKMKAPR